VCKNRKALCDGLLKKKVGEFLTEENLKRQLLSCLNSSFENDSLRFWYDEALTVNFGSKFFSKLCFKSRGRVSKRKLSGFHKTMIDLQKKPKFAGEFFINGRLKPTPINPRMKMSLCFVKLLERKKVINEITIEHLIYYIENLWKKIKNELLWNSPYNIMMRNL